MLRHFDPCLFSLFQCHFPHKGDIFAEQLAGDLIVEHQHRDRYLCSTKGDKGRMLDEFTVVTGLHRKHAIRLLAGSKYEKEEGTRWREDASTLKPSVRRR